jgi:hypothetical protein
VSELKRRRMNSIEQDKRLLHTSDHKKEGKKSKSITNEKEQMNN